MIQTRITRALLACVAAVITAWAAAGVSVAAQAATPGRPDLTGQWQLNKDLSDDAQEKLQSRGGAGEHAGRGGGGHGPGRHGGGRAEEEMGPEMKEAHDLILNAPIHFVLTQDGQKVVLTEPDGHVRALPTNNRPVKVDGRDVRTRWESNRLVSETTVGNAKVIETYERSPSPPQLLVTVKIEMPRRDVSLRRVYDAVTEQPSIPRENAQKETEAERGSMSWALPAGGAVLGGGVGFALGGPIGALIGVKAGAVKGWLIGKHF
ncbi:MAG: hypothetical protein GEV06_11305 [Luteitalea sp.]|nr:hypothetical protein [Luteitalea sp.]